MYNDRLKKMWGAGDPVLNAWLTIPSSWSAELLSHTGFDALTIDMQHGLIDYNTSVSMLQAISPEKTVPLVRVPWNEPSTIMKILDAGAYGIICPMVNSKSEAEKFVGSCKYPPDGYRSYGPIRANISIDNYYKEANDHIITMAMIETEEGLNNLEDILDTEGLTGVYIGTVDLSISLGLTELGNLQDLELKKAIDRILTLTADKDKVVGIHASSPTEAAMLAKWGFKLITPLNDSKSLLNTSKNMYELTKKEIDENEN